MRYFLFLTIGFLSFFETKSFGQQAATKEILETTYNTWRQSMIQANYPAWRTSTAESRQMRVRNQAISEKRDFPDSIFLEPVKMPSLVGLTFVGIQQKGRTIAATYYGPIDFSVGGSPTKNAFVLLFVDEGMGWRYDSSRFFNLEAIPQVRKRLAAGDTKILAEQDGFQPTGKVVPVPSPCPAPQYIAKIFYDAPGRSVDVTINGISRHLFSNSRNAEVIWGGLHLGANEITCKISDGEGDQGPLRIEVFVMPETQGNVPGKAFSFKLSAKEKNPEKTTTGTITVDVPLLNKMIRKKSA